MKEAEELRSTEIDLQEAGQHEVERLRHLFQVDRRDLFKLLGAGLVVGIARPSLAAQESGRGRTEELPRDIASWLHVGADGKITVFTGKCELGQGIKTALIQVAAEELAVPPEAIHLVTADTALTPDEGYTAGSHSMQDSGTAIRHAAAQVRQLLIGAAAQEWQLAVEQLYVEGGAVIAKPAISTPVVPARRAGYGELVGNNLLHVRADPDAKPVEASQHRLVGTSLPRVDIPAKVAGGEAYV